MKKFPKAFLLVVAGQVVSLFGNAVLRFALPLYLLRQTGSPALFGLVSSAAILPMLACSLVGGVVADRVDKARVMVALDGCTALLSLGVALLLPVAPAVPLTVAALMLLYAVQGIYQPTVQASIPALLRGEQILRGNAVINMVGTLAELLGPAIGGLLFGAWGLAPLLLVGGGCFAASSAMELWIRIPRQKRAGQGGVVQVALGDLRESWRYLRWEKPLFLRVTALLAVFNMVLSSAWVIGVPLLVVNHLGMPDAALGLAQSAMGLGGLAGGMLAGMLAGRLRLRQGAGFLVACSLSVACLGVAALPGMPPAVGYWLITALTVAAMACATTLTVQLCSAVQAQVPPELIGKVMAGITAVAMAAQPVGQAAYGLLFQLCAARPWAVLFGAGALSLLVAAASRPLFTALEREC